MDLKLRVVSGAIGAFACVLCFSNGAVGQALPDGKGKAEFVHNCTACHTAKMVTRLKRTPEEWRVNVDNMAARGTDGSKEDLDNVVLYLVTNFATDKSGPTATTHSITPSSTTPAGPAVLNSLEVDHAKNLIRDNGCLACHRVEKEGMYTGPSLNGVGGRLTADQIRTAVVSPHPMLGPGNTLIRLTTADGRTIAGRILKQDDHDVRVIDASGEVATYAKPSLRQITIIDNNPMPSYEKRITGGNLEGLVRYLGSLPSVDGTAEK